MRLPRIQLKPTKHVKIVNKEPRRYTKHTNDLNELMSISVNQEPHTKNTSSVLTSNDLNLLLNVANTNLKKAQENFNEFITKITTNLQYDVYNDKVKFYIPGLPKAIVIERNSFNTNNRNLRERVRENIKRQYMTQGRGTTTPYSEKNIQNGIKKLIRQMRKNEIETQMQPRMRGLIRSEMDQMIQNEYNRMFKRMNPNTARRLLVNTLAQNPGLISSINHQETLKNLRRAKQRLATLKRQKANLFT